MRRVARAGGFLAHAVDAMNYRRLLRFESQPKRELVRDRLQILSIAFPFDLPIPVPDSAAFRINTSNARPRTVQSFAMIKFSAADVAQRQMSHIHVWRGPVGSFLHIAGHCFTEKSEFETEFVPVGASQIPGVIPPLSLKIRMIEIIAGKFVTVTGYGAAILRHQRIR